LRQALPLIALACLAGCYHVGVEPVEGARAIAVPTFENATLRREIEHALTRHVRREVLEATPLHLEREGEAKLILRGSVAAVDEAVLIAGAAEEVIHGAITITARFGVYDPAGQLVVGEDGDGDGRPDGTFVRQGYAEFTRVRGESRDTAVDEAVRDLAEMIVQELTARHDDRFEPNDDASAATPVAPGRQVALLQRNPDWFRATVPPGLALHATLFWPDGRLALDLRGTGGEPLDGAVVAPDGRSARLPPGAVDRFVLVRVTGDDRGRTYQLLLRLLPE
jgi:hypothetical protein